MIPIEAFEVRNMSGRVVPIAPDGHSVGLTFQNRKEYFDKALHFRLHELDSQVKRFILQYILLRPIWLVWFSLDLRITIGLVYVYATQVAVVREGMATIIPVPVLSLYTPKMLENAVCGLEQVDLNLLKKVVR